MIYPRITPSKKPIQRMSVSPSDVYITLPPWVYEDREQVRRKSFCCTRRKNIHAYDASHQCPTEEDYYQIGKKVYNTKHDPMRFSPSVSRSRSKRTDESYQSWSFSERNKLHLELKRAYPTTGTLLQCMFFGVNTHIKMRLARYDDEHSYPSRAALCAYGRVLACRE